MTRSLDDLITGDDEVHVPVLHVHVHSYNVVILRREYVVIADVWDNGAWIACDGH